MDEAVYFIPIGTNIMTPELEKQVASLIETANQTGKDAVSFIQTQAPEVASQIVRWDIIGGLLLFFIIITLGVSMLIFRSKVERGDDKAVLAFLATFAFIISAIPISTALKAYLCPNLVVMETIGDMVKK
jgi:cytochrome bd-type quinol oxidase subunit 1